MPVLATVAEVVFTFFAVVLFAIVTSLVFLAYANNEMFIHVITNGGESIRNFSDSANTHIKSKI